ncbi:MAG TPA: ABC transporter permease subunit [Candidatus Saccharimonadales bacterium]|nr:ABC transporter permease subunit [Candidatus Saccharimonadales bacterium]
MIVSWLWELRHRRFALLWWTLGSVLLTVLIMLLYPSIRDQANQLNQVINQLPPGLRELKTGGSASVNMADPVAFLNSQLFYATLPIIWIILAVTRGSGVLGRDESDHTLELLLARPLSRGRLLLAKALSLLTEFVVVAGATLLAILILAPRLDMHVSSGRLVTATAYTAAFALSFGLIAFTLQAASQATRRAAGTVAVFIGFGGYVIASLSGLTDWLAGPAKLAPYHYFTPDKILQGHAVNGLDIYLVGVLVLAVVLSYFGFRRRDIA